MNQQFNVSAQSGYQRSWRRLLVDMEIPWWDEHFLAQFDPVAMADLYSRTGATGVMFSCKALTGLCFWPTAVGARHPGIGDRDVVGETFAALNERGIASCAYYSVIFDNWAFEHHADWRIEPLHAVGSEPSAWDRHGCCCPNNPGYRDYVREQIADLYGRYEFECAFCDMTFWPAVCGCHNCRSRYADEGGGDLPDTVDWTSPGWCRFQESRERWIDEFAGLVTDAMRVARPRIAVYHNFAPALGNWVRGLPFTFTRHNDFLGGDLYGDEVEQLLVTKLMGNLGRSRPAEFMTFGTTGVSEHVQLKRPARMRSQALSAAAQSTAFMLIDAIDPVGTANPGHYDAFAEAFEAGPALDAYLGGEPVEDVAVYFSSESKMDFAENGRRLDQGLPLRPTYPHLDAVRGACRILQESHIPFGVITRRQLERLDQYRVVVLPNVLRMDPEEAEAIRKYVRGGGRVYASGYTSLVEAGGIRHDDFMLSDVLGARLDREEPAGMVYAKPATAELRDAIAPQQFLSHDFRGVGTLAGGLLRLRAADGARVLATLSLPYGHPDVGNALDHRWASTHSWPPWEHTHNPALVEHSFGSGRTVYSALPVEVEGGGAGDALFARLIRELLEGHESFESDVAPVVWLSAFHHPDSREVRVSVLNTPPALVAPATLRLRARDGTRFVAVRELPSGRALPFEPDGAGGLRCRLEPTEELAMLAARYEPS